MVLVRKVGQINTIDKSPLSPSGRDLLAQAQTQLLHLKTVENQNEDLRSQLVQLQNRPPEIVEVEKEVIREVFVEDPALLETVSELKARNEAIQTAVAELDTRTGSALVRAHEKILALEASLQKIKDDHNTRIDNISALTTGRWPFIRKKTLRTTLEK